MGTPRWDHGWDHGGTMEEKVWWNHWDTTAGSWWDHGDTTMGPWVGPWWDHGGPGLAGPRGERGGTCPIPPPSPLQLSSFEVAVSFAVVSFASRARVVVSTAEDESADADEVLHRLENMTFAGASRAADGGGGTSPPRCAGR